MSVSLKSRGEKRAAFALIGKPIDRSPSPQMHNASFSALEFAGDYCLRPTTEDGVAAVVGELRVGTWAGLNVTTPLKTIMATHMDRLVGYAARAKAVNTVWLDSGALCGALTDVDGVREPLAAASAGGEGLVIGSGGAARAAMLALEGICSTVNVAARRPDAAASVLSDLRLSNPGLIIDLGNDKALGSVFSRAGVIVQATPVGRNGERHCLPWQRISHGDSPQQSPVAFEMLYLPRETPFLAEARAAGCTAIEGWEMLLSQGVVAQRFFTGRNPDNGAMKRALLGALGASSGSGGSQ